MTPEFNPLGGLVVISLFLFCAFGIPLIMNWWYEFKLKKIDKERESFRSTINTYLNRK